ncbi:hypothetical protein IP510_08015 [Psychrobacter sp. NG254]|uniref:hypothetical protein n=1 Tax=Psychrobacter sp. NG254 TaxID=2782003 RepID=UPI0018897E62|nr:hypothetical protein [Psychrobacter sp. NG254]MBF2719824.1 hypothetical protein [Psychrobacter sp. NG254]
MKVLSSHSKRLTAISMPMLLTAIVLFTTGCSTTQEFRPTASVLVGAQTSL